MVARVTSIKNITKGKWLVIYYESLPCLCGEIRKSFEWSGVNAPSKEEIQKKLKDNIVIYENRN